MRFLANRYAFVIATACFWLVLDQISKAAVVATIELNRGFEVLSGCFNLVHVQNRGAAFGFLNSTETDWQIWLFAAAALFAAILIFYTVRRAACNRVLFFGMGSILGGAFGNLVDRVTRFAVTDFLDFYWGQWHWPAFNVADIAICLGAAVSGWLMLRSPQDV